VPRTHFKRTHAATADDCLAGSRLTGDVIEAAAHVANDGIAFTGDVFGGAACLAEMLPIYVSANPCRRSRRQF
jgi:hypothetical protein